MFIASPDVLQNDSSVRSEMYLNNYIPLLTELVLLLLLSRSP